jgi:DNA primase
MDEKNLREVLSQLGITVERKSGDWLTAKCPLALYFHSHGKDYHPSFGAHTESGNYNCFTCHQKGHISELARILGQYRFNNQFHYSSILEIIDSLYEELLVPNFEKLPQIHNEKQEPLIEEIYDNIYTPALDNKQAMEYLEFRGIGAGTTEKLGLRWDDYQKRVLFPVRWVDSSLMGFSGRAINNRTQPKIRDYAGLRKKQHILGVDRWRWDKYPLIIVEGLLGFAWLHELNVEAVADIGALLGSELTEYKRQLIIKRNTETFLLSDNDQAGHDFLFGRENRKGALVKLKGQGFRVYAPQWPFKKLDPDELSKQDLWRILQLKFKERKV